MSSRNLLVLMIATLMKAGKVIKRLQTLHKFHCDQWSNGQRKIKDGSLSVLFTHELRSGRKCKINMFVLHFDMDCGNDVYTLQIMYAVNEK